LKTEHPKQTFEGHLLLTFADAHLPLV